MTQQRPEPGLVIRYSYLWTAERDSGRDEGIKDRPCAIVLAAPRQGDRMGVLVVPVTHRQPDNPDCALELPVAIKAHLGLDDARSWVILSESNYFRWPGPDLRRVPGKFPPTAVYGYLPPRFFNELKRRFVALVREARSRNVGRTE